MKIRLEIRENKRKREERKVQDKHSRQSKHAKTMNPDPYADFNDKVLDETRAVLLDELNKAKNDSKEKE